MEEEDKVTRSKWAKTTNVCELWSDSEDFNDNKIFYIGPFAEPFKTLFYELIKPTVESYSVECYRDDAKKISERFLKRIITSIKTSRMVIADLSKDRPNVYYELGWVSAIATPSLIITSEERPSDLSLLTIERYDFTEQGLKKLEKLIQDTLIELEKTKSDLETGINYSKIIKKFNEVKIQDAELLWLIPGEEPDKILFNKEIRIKRTELLTREELGLTPINMEEMQKHPRTVDFMTKLSMSGKSLDSFKKESEIFNKELKKHEEKLDEYIFQRTCYDHGEEVVFCFFNEGTNNLRNGYIECSFPSSIFIIDIDKPRRPVSKKPGLSLWQNLLNIQITPITRNYPIMIREREPSVVGPLIKDQHKVYLRFKEIEHHRSLRFKEHILVTAFETGIFPIEWKLYLEGSSEPIVGILCLIVEE